jgi:hypothetical protein
VYKAILGPAIFEAQVAFEIEPCAKVRLGKPYQMEIMIPDYIGDVYLWFHAHKFLNDLNILEQYTNRVSPPEIEYIPKENEAIDIVPDTIDEIYKPLPVALFYPQMHI